MTLCRGGTDTNWIEFLEEVTTMIDEGRTADVVYVDFSEAFGMARWSRGIRET